MSTLGYRKAFGDDTQFQSLLYWIDHVDRRIMDSYLRTVCWRGSEGGIYDVAGVVSESKNKFFNMALQAKKPKRSGKIMCLQNSQG